MFIKFSNCFAMTNYDPVIKFDDKSSRRKVFKETSVRKRFLQKSCWDLEQTPETLKDADWKPLAHNPEAIKSPAVAFEASIPGNLGAADINDYPDTMEAVIQPAHGGKGIHRASGKLMAELAAVLPSGMPTVDFTTIILGPSQGDSNKMQVWTFHPGAPAAQGAPIFLEDMKKEFDTEDDRILTTVGKAKELGFVTIKHIDSLPKKEEEKSDLIKEGFLFRRNRRNREFFC